MSTKDSPESSSDESATGADATEGTSTLSRRPFIKATGASLLTAGLAGCGGDGGDGTTTSPTATIDAPDLSGLEFDFWEREYFSESPDAQTALESVISTFEEQTGATVNVNFQGDDQPLIDAFNQGTYPQGMTVFAQGMGPWMQTGKIHPFSEYQDEFDYDVMDSVGALSDALDFCFRGWDEGNTLFPVTANIFAPFVGRMDLYEEAGLSPEDDFPPEDADELVEQATTLQEESSAQVGYQPVHDTVDNQDVYFNQWMSAEGGADGYFLNDDWSDLNFQNDIWDKWLKFDIGLYTEHGFGTPDTPTMNDEEIPPLTVGGQVALSNQAPMNLPGWRETGGQMYEDNIQWAPSFGEAYDTGVNGRALIPGGSLMEAPDGADQATWEEKRNGALELLVYLNDPVLQVDVMPELGFHPANQNLWDEIEDDGNGFVETIQETAQNARYSYPAHPDFGPIGYDIFGVKKQNASRGELTPEEVLSQSYEEGMAIVEESQWG